MRGLGGLLSLTILVGCGSYKNPGGGGGGDGPDAGAGGVDPDAGGDTPSEVVTCPDPVPPPSEGSCDVTPGSGTAVFLRGTVLGNGTIYENGGVLYDGTQIQCVGCDCASSDAAASATRVDCANAVISPGIIDAHDHTTFNEGWPIDHGTTRYDHRHEWRAIMSTPANEHGSDGTLWSEVRMMLGGTTSMVSGANGVDGAVRNLDDLEGDDQALGFEQVNSQTFSLGDGNRTFHADCGWNYKYTELEAAEEHAFLPHVAEGINDYAAEEFRCQSTSFDGGRDYTEKNATHIHSIGLGAAEYLNMVRDHTKLIWSPRSNISLYGQTAMVSTFDRLGGTVALGTDWTYSGSGNMLRELACADEYNRDNLSGYFTDEQLWKMATWNAAVATGTEATIGSLEAEKVADIAVFAAAEGVHHRAVLEAENQDVLLVVKSGRALFGEADVVGTLEVGGCETLDVCGASRQICLEQSAGTTYAALAAEVNGAYPAIFCGAPQDEPTCVPSREGEFTGVPSASDPDGDGLEGAADNCADMFNPLRPIDGGAQADADGDGIGDVCDESPVGDDIDADGVANVTDNCPFRGNEDQLDGDNDLKGDTCDFCPTVANQDTVCGVTPPIEGSIMDIQMGSVPVGTTVTIKDAIVTGVWANGAWVQDPSASTYAGIHVFTGPLTDVSVGDKVDATGKVLEYFGDTELDDSTITVTGTGSITPVELTVTQALDEAYEGMLVRVMDVSAVESPYDCTADNSACADDNLWRANSMLIVYDRLYGDADWASQASAGPVAGVMMTRFDRRRIMPRRSADFAD